MFVLTHRCGAACIVGVHEKHKKHEKILFAFRGFCAFRGQEVFSCGDPPPLSIRFVAPCARSNGMNRAAVSRATTGQPTVHGCPRKTRKTKRIFSCSLCFLWTRSFFLRRSSPLIHQICSVMRMIERDESRCRISYHDWSTDRTRMSTENTKNKRILSCFLCFSWTRSFSLWMNLSVRYPSALSPLLSASSAAASRANMSSSSLRPCLAIEIICGWSL